MTTGQLVFYAGVILLAATIVLAVVFAVKKPEYHPENAALASEGERTAPLRNGFPTDRLTVRRAARKREGAARERVEQAPGEAPGETVLLSGDTLPLAAETLPLPAETAPLETVPLKEATTPLGEDFV